MSRAAAASATQAKSNLYVVTLPDGRMVISSQPLLHNEKGAAVNALAIKPVKALDLAAISLLAKFIVLNNENVIFVTFSSKQKVIDAYVPWINIFQFLFGATFQTHVADNPAQQLARFSACIARPSLLLATDEVVRAALCGDEDLARRMIALNPNYLLQRGNATDFSGHTYANLTPFQAALITGDIEMAEMIKPFFARLEDGEKTMQKQVTEIFPNGIDAHEAAQKRKSETDFEPMLKAVITAIKDAKPADLQAALSLKDNNSALCKALDTFRGEFTELSHSEIFNPHHLLKAFEAYANQFDWNTPDWNKLDLFWCQVIGFVQRFLPANYAQVFAYGLYDIVENKQRCPRSFNFKYDPGFSFYPSVGLTGLGFNYGAGGLTRRMPAVRLRHVCFKTYVEQKQHAFRTYYAASAIDSVRNSMTPFC